MTLRVTVVDYGMGNLWSVASAFTFLGVDCRITDRPDEVARADLLVLPGVGSFRSAMAALRNSGLADSLHEAVRNRQRKILGICLGMQLLGEASTEDGETPGLGFIPRRVERFAPADLAGLKVPHVGFNRVVAPRGSRLFCGLEPAADFYFVHSYRMLPEDLPGQAAICRYGVDFLAAYEDGTVLAVQFHPEKSQTNGLRLLSNFLAA